MENFPYLGNNIPRGADYGEYKTRQVARVRSKRLVTTSVNVSSYDHTVSCVKVIPSNGLTPSLSSLTKSIILLEVKRDRASRAFGGAMLHDCVQICLALTQKACMCCLQLDRH